MEPSPYELTFDLPYGHLLVEYLQGPEVVPGETKKLMIRINHVRYIEAVVAVKMLLPEGWRSLEGGEYVRTVKSSHTSCIPATILVGEFSGAYCYLPLEIRLSDRCNPITVTIPLQRKGSVEHNTTMLYQDFWDDADRIKSQIAASGSN